MSLKNIFCIKSEIEKMKEKINTIIDDACKKDVEIKVGENSIYLEIGPNLEKAIHNTIHWGETYGCNSGVMLREAFGINFTKIIKEKFEKKGGNKIG